MPHTTNPVLCYVSDRRSLEPTPGGDAADLVAVEYEPLPAVTDARAALAPGAPQIWNEAPGNLCVDVEVGDEAAAEAAARAAARDAAWDAQTTLLFEYLNGTRT